jgi:hypothetical protein
MIGIGTPKSQSRMPRPMALSFQPPFSKMYIARGRVWFPRGSRKPCASQAAPSPTQNGAGDAWVGPPCIVDAPHHCTSTRLFIWLRSRRPRVHRSPKRVPLDSFGPLGSSGFQDRRVRSDVRVVGCDLLRRHDNRPLRWQSHEERCAKRWSIVPSWHSRLEDAHALPVAEIAFGSRSWGEPYWLSAWQAC